MPRATFDAAGRVTGLYDDAAAFPASASEVTEDERMQLAEYPDGWRWDGAKLAARTPPVDLAGYARTKQAAILAAGARFNVAAAGAPAKPILCDGTNPTRADLALLVLSAQAAPTGSQTWVDNHGASTVLAAAEVIALATAAGTWMAGTYTALAKVLDGLAATPPAYTTTAQVDAVFAPPATPAA